MSIDTNAVAILGGGTAAKQAEAALINAGYNVIRCYSTDKKLYTVALILLIGTVEPQDANLRSRIVLVIPHELGETSVQAWKQRRFMEPAETPKTPYGWVVLVKDRLPVAFTGTS